MNRIINLITEGVLAFIRKESPEFADQGSIQLEETRKEFIGDFTINVFRIMKQLKGFPGGTSYAPQDFAQKVGEHLKVNIPEIRDFNVINGFLNLSLSDACLLSLLQAEKDAAGMLSADKMSGKGQTIMLEYSSPNTNKPLHLGHIRNNLLGWSLSKILKACGYRVIRANLINDRGIHICKSMLAWMKWGQGETPESSGIKGDHLAGKYYVRFDKEYKKEVETLVNSGKSKEEAEQSAPLMQEAQEMLRKWEQGDEETLQLWRKMNAWVYSGFEVTYNMLGVEFDKIYYESQTYLFGKRIVMDGLEQQVFYKKDDGSVWVDLRDAGLDEKVLLRSDGTSVYMTQDIGTAELRFEEFSLSKLIYVVGSEQEYHFKVLQQIFKKLDRTWADGIYHLSYGMVDLPTGKMKSREGTVVDADELMETMVMEAERTTKELGKVEAMDEASSTELYKTIGLGALKYFILKVDPRKRMLFNPAESIDFEGNTGPFIQYTYARICSLIKKAGAIDLLKPIMNVPLEKQERDLMKNILAFPDVVKRAGTDYNPSLIANYTYDLVKAYNQFYHELPVLREEDLSRRQLRLRLSFMVSDVIKTAMDLLGIRVPERM